MSDWSDFAREHNFENVFREAAERAIAQLLAQDSTRSYTGFGADCNAEYGDIFLTALWSEEPDLPKLKDSFGWIAEWDGAFFSDPVFEKTKPLEKFKLAIQTHLENKFDEIGGEPPHQQFLDYSAAFCGEFMDVVTRVLFEIQQKTPALESALFLVIDHDEMNEDAIKRLERITGRRPFSGV